MIDELELVRRERPDVDPASPSARRNAESRLAAAIATSPSRRRERRLPPLRLGLGRLAPVAALLVGVAVVAVFLGGHSRRTPVGPSAAGGPEVVFQAQPVGPIHGIKVSAVARAAGLLQQLIGPGARVTTSGDRVVVHVPSDPRVTQAQLLSLVGITGRLAFYDWEADALTPSGRPTAELLTRNNPAALLLSEGGGASAPGSPGAGTSSLYTAVALASRQPAEVSADNGRAGPQYFAFGAAGSSACGAAARTYRVRTTPSVHCYLSGPAPTRAQALAWMPAGVSRGAAQVLGVPQGMVVLQAAPQNNIPPQSNARPRSLSDPMAQFYALRDHVALFGYSVTKPSPGTDQSGSPDVTIQFTAKGAAAFQAMTARVAHRGDLVSGLGQTLNQHFAVALGDQLVTVPSIDFKTYPDGVPGDLGANITGGFDARTVRRAALEVQLGALPIALQLVSAPPSGG